MPDVVNENGTWVIKQDSNLSSLEINTIDLTDGSWTFLDTMSQVKTNTFANNINTVNQPNILGTYLIDGGCLYTSITS